jgi:hypothetical protein
MKLPIFHDSIISIYCFWEELYYLILPFALGPGVYSASNRNVYQKHNNNVSRE